MNIFDDYDWHYDPKILQWCKTASTKLIGNNTKRWNRKGSWMEYWKGDKRIALAPHKGGLSIYFSPQDGSPLIYKEMGGVCPTGKCVIRIPYKNKYDTELLKFIIVKYL